MDEEEDPPASFALSMFRRRCGSSAPSDTRSSKNRAFGSSGNEGIRSASDGLPAGPLGSDVDAEVEEEDAGAVRVAS